MNTSRPSVEQRARILASAALLVFLPLGAFGQAAPDLSSFAPKDKDKDKPKDEAVQLQVFNVNEDRDIGYESMQTTSGMRTVQELKNLPNSISILNSQLLEDIAATNLDEAMRWSISGEDNPEPLNVQVDSRVVMRGIPNAYAMRNGWIWYSPMDSYSTERVELLRGPNSFLYGEADVGGAQNQMTKRGLFGRKINRVKLMLGSDEMRRGEIDINRPIVPNKLAMRFSTVKMASDSWINNVKHDMWGAYVALSYRPFTNTQIHIMAEHNEANDVRAAGLLIDQFSRTATVAIPANQGVVYLPATGRTYRAAATGRVNSTGPGTTIIDPSILPKNFHHAGPNSTFENYYQSVTVEAEHHIGKNLHLQLSANWYQRNIDQQNIQAGRNVLRDTNRTLPDGTANPYFGELYTEYFRGRREHGNMVKDVRFSGVYDFQPFRWMKQQLLANVQQHQDNPYHFKPAWGEYVDESNPLFTGTINRAITQAAYTANRATFTNNRFTRRYYFNKDGLKGSEDMGPVPGLSAWYPDLSNVVGAAGHQLWRRFYTPSWGVGASGTYFNGHLFTHVGYRTDQFKMKTRFVTVRPNKDEWVVDEIPGLFPANQLFVKAKVHGSNYGGILRLNDTFAIGYNWAQSFRISTGEGADTYRVGEKQGVPIGEGTEISARFSLFPDASRRARVEINFVKYHNYRPNDRFSPGASIQVRDELGAIFPTQFNNAATTDYQTTTTDGYEFEMTTNITRNWRLTFNVGTNKVVTEDRAPILHEFRDAAKALGKPTPLLDDFLLTIPEGVPNAGYTKARGNIFTRYTFTQQGWLRGAYVGGGVQYRQETYRGTGDHDSNPATPVVAMYSPGYSLYTLLAGYSTRVFQRPTNFAVNVSNVFDKDYYRSGGVASGSWGDPRSFRFTMSMDF